MGQVSFTVPGPGTYQVECDPKLDPLSSGGTAADVLSGKQFYNDQNAAVTGTMPNNPPQEVEVSGGESYTIPAGYHTGSGKVTGTGTVLPTLSAPADAGDILIGTQAIDQAGEMLTGTMPDNGAVSAELAAGGSYTTPAGYHNGHGTVTSIATPLPALTSPAAPSDILSGKEAIDQTGAKVTGTMPQKTAADVTASGAEVTVPAGYYPQPATKAVESTEQAIPTISVDDEGLITAESVQTGGYVEAGTKSATQQLDTQAAQTITPGTADQTIPAGKYLIGAQTIQGDSGLVPENIKQGVSLFGVTGSYSPGLPAGVRTISVTADPPEGGSVSGGGVASDGMTVTVKAAANGGYKSIGWEENGITISDKKDYTFVVGEDRTLIGLFGEFVLDWIPTQLPSALSLSAIAYGDGKFVATGYGPYMHSNDGINWTQGTIPASTTKNWVAVTYGDDKFVAVTNGAPFIAYSGDGINWTVKENISTLSNFKDVVYGNGKFVALLDTKAEAYSYNGIDWTVENFIWGNYSGFEHLAYGNGIFVAVSHYSKVSAISSDGISWASITPLPIPVTYITYGNGLFVAVGDAGVLYSEDGINWGKADLPVSKDWSNITYGNGIFVIIAEGSNLIISSDDGINWRQSSIPQNPWRSVCYGDGKFVAVAFSSDQSAYAIT